jgi:hypothetical protein
MASQDHFVERDHRRIGRQIQLPLSKAFEIAWKGIMIRLFRSMITMSGVVLAIAFLMSVWANGAIVQSLLGIPEGTRDRLLAESVLQRQAIATQSVVLRVGVISAEARRVPSAREQAQAFRNQLEPFSEFEPVIVPHDAEEFERSLLEYDALVLLGLPESFATPGLCANIAEWVKGGGTLVVLGWDGMFPADRSEPKAAIEAVLPALPGETQIAVDGGLLKWDRQDRIAHGLEWARFPGRSFYECRPGNDARGVVSFEGKPVLWTAEVEDGHVAFFPWVGQPDKALFDWLSENDLLGRCIRWGEAAQLRAGSGSSRNLWLIGLSLIVCIVGITNAMLMSVTERFREIGTMKCLGALDIFIVKLFLIESALMGVVGTLLGISIGLLLTAVRSTFSFTIEDPATEQAVYLGLRYFPVAAILLRVLFAFAVGVLLSILAAIYPAYTAARMEPVEAMRVEE